MRPRSQRSTDFVAERLARIEIVRGDIVEEAVDAIVNAANAQLKGGGGVDGAIHRAAGPKLLQSCARLHPDGCPTGEARLTPGFELKASWVIHAVGPVYRDGQSGERELLASAYRASMVLAAEHGLTRIAFPAISTGAYGYPAEEAAEVAITALARAWSGLLRIRTVRLVLFSEEMRDLFEEERRRLVASANSGGSPA